ncbi:MAG: hypothetical protein ACTSU5_19735 [Promethearchaeota archaeon]
MRPKIEKITRFLFCAWLVYFSFLVACVNVMMSLHGEHPAFMVYFWEVFAAVVLGGILIAWKYDSVLVRAFAVGYLVFVGYLSTRMLVEEMVAMAPGTLAYHVILFVGLAANLLLFLGELVGAAVHRGLHERFAGSWARLNPRGSRLALFLEASAVALVVLYPLSYGCFLQSVEIRDDPGNHLKVSFYHHPTGGMNYSWYVDPFSKALADEEMARYQELNSTFYFGCGRGRFTDPQSVANMTATIRYFQNWGLDVVPVVAPVVEVPPGSGNFSGDFSTYYNYQYDLETIDLLMDWLDANPDLTNVRGLSLDVEGPKYAKQRGEVINESLWREAAAAYQAKFDEFQQRFPGRITHLIAMSGIAKDFYDGDDDLDVAQKTCSVPPTWTTYGHMFYEIDDVHTGYHWMVNVEHAIEEFGVDRTVPWIGWFGAPDTLDKNPGWWENAKEQVKIGKSLGVHEVILAPVRNLRGTNHTVAMQRLDELVSIREDGFETFATPVRHNRRLYTDFPTYLEKIVPWYFIGDGDVYKDLVYGTPGGWFVWCQLALLAGLAAAYWRWEN